VPAKAVSNEPVEAACHNSAGVTNSACREDDGLEGGLLAITSDGVLGWAWKPADPSIAVEADIVCNGQILSSIIADLFSNPAIRSRIGSGIPGFLAKLSLQPAGPYPITLQLHSRTGGLLGDPLVINHPRELSTVVQGLGASSFEGYVDYVADGYVTGWAWKPADPAEQVAVELMEGEIRLDRALASIHRQDLASCGKRGGSCGFRLELPISLLDDRVHVLHVIIANTQIKLSGCSLTFGPQTAAPLLKEISRLRSQVADLAALVDRIVSPLGELQTSLIRALSERMGALIEVQRETVHSELDALRALALRPASDDSVTRRTTHRRATPARIKV
jgi:hypothetical protein